MADTLEKLVQQAESDITNRGDGFKPGGEAPQQRVPRFSIAIAIWLTVVVATGFQFDSIISALHGTTESKIERDLEVVVSRAAESLKTYESTNGVLPYVLPNPAIRGLVRYERQSDFSFRLTATISQVTMVMDSSSTHPRRHRKTD